MTTRATSAVLVGRQAELAALRDAFKRARDDEPTAVLVGGEAGVGKTRLLDEFRRYVENDGGARVLTGQCLELGEEGLPFAPFAAVLREILRRDGRAAFDGHEAEFARLLPELGPSASPAENRGYLFDLVASLFATLAAERPLVLVIEDLHWADKSTRDLIGFLVRAARTARALLVCTYRTDELHRGHPLRPFLAELDRARGVERVDVDRLDRDGTAEILTDLFGVEPSQRAVELVHERAQGNPFFVEELAAAGDPDSCADIPDSLRDLLLARVDRLPDKAQPVLRIAAAGGTRIAHELLAQVAGVPDTELEQALRAAVAAQLVVADADGGYEFRHALVREAVHDDLLPGEHARLHARYAATIEATPHLVSAGRAPAEIAHHWYAAHDHPKALVATHIAAGEASRRYAYAEAARLLERVLELWEQVPDAAERLGMDHLALTEETLAAAYSAGDHMRALSLTRAALAEVDADAEPLRAARIYERRGKLLGHLGKSDGIPEIRRAYELIRDNPDPEKARLLAELAYHIGRLDRAEGARIANEARIAAEELGDDSAQVQAALVLGRVCTRELRAEDGMPELRRAEAMARERGDLESLVKARVNISDALFELGEYEESARSAAAGTADALKIGVSRSNGAFLRSNQAEALVALGRWDEAEVVLAESARFDPPGHLGVHWVEVRAGLRVARGHPGAGELVNRALAFLSRPYVDPQIRLPLHVLGMEAALARDDLEAAARAARAGLADGDLDENPRYSWPLMVAVTRVMTAGVEDLRPALTEIAARLEKRYPPELACAAEVAAALSGDDVTSWEAAVEARRADGQPYPLARALIALAQARAAAGDRAGAAVALEEAGAIAADLDARPTREAVAVLARRVGLRGAVGAGPDVLTAREKEVLRLVAEGHSNSRIGAELYLSPKTVSVHVSRIIAKLEVANRIEAAAVAHRLGLF